MIWKGSREIKLAWKKICEKESVYIYVCVFLCLCMYVTHYILHLHTHIRTEFYVCMHGCILFRLPLFQGNADQASGRVDDKGQEDSCGFDGRESLE